jgi:hypothetical protein
MQFVRNLWGRGLLGKLLVGGSGLLIACCVLGVIVGPKGGTSPTGSSTQVAAAVTSVAPTSAPVATRQPTEAPIPTAVPTAAPLPGPTEEPAPPTAAPTKTPVVPTAVAVGLSPVPAPADEQPTYTGSGRNITVSPAWYPCKKGQVKGNRNSNIYHVPGGQSYAKTFRDVACFDTAAQAESVGYQAAQR